jgi:hypothetical protein
VCSSDLRRIVAIRRGIAAAIRDYDDEQDDEAYYGG